APEESAKPRPPEEGTPTVGAGVAVEQTLGVGLLHERGSPANLAAAEPARGSTLPGRLAGPCPRCGDCHAGTLRRHAPPAPRGDLKLLQIRDSTSPLGRPKTK